MFKRKMFKKTALFLKDGFPNLKPTICFYMLYVICYGVATEKPSFLGKSDMVDEENKH